MAGSFEPKADTEIIGRAGGMTVHAPVRDPGDAASSPAEPAPPPAPPDTLRRLRRQILELAIVALLTLACFTVFIVFLDFSFPEGNDLRALLRSNPGESAAGDGVAGNRAGSAGGSGTSLATLSVVRASVHSRTSGSIAWNPARTGLGLQAGDGIQTGASGAAELQMGHGVLRLERNSLVILGDATGVADVLAHTPRSLTVVRGELFARLKGRDAQAMTITLPQGVARINTVPEQGGTPDVPAGDRRGGAESSFDPPSAPGQDEMADPESPAEFRITTGSDRTSAVMVLKGSVALEANGKQVHVGPGQYSRIGADGTPSDPLAVPAAPIALAPAQGTKFAYLDLPPVVPFRWVPAEGEGHYRLRATRGPDYRDAVVDEATTDSTLAWGRLAPGTYRWQVSQVVDGVEGIPSAPRTLIVEPSGGPLELQVEALPMRVVGPRLAVRGKTRPDASVYVMGQPAPVRGDGTFDVQVDIPPGANIVLIEAVDAAGHSTFSSHVVYAAN